MDSSNELSESYKCRGSIANAMRAIGEHLLFSNPVTELGACEPSSLACDYGARSDSWPSSDGLDYGERELVLGCVGATQKP